MRIQIHLALKILCILILSGNYFQCAAQSFWGDPFSQDTRGSNIKSLSYKEGPRLEQAFYDSTGLAMGYNNCYLLDSEMYYNASTKIYSPEGTLLLETNMENSTIPSSIQYYNDTTIYLQYSDSLISSIRIMVVQTGGDSIEDITIDTTFIDRVIRDSLTVITTYRKEPVEIDSIFFFPSMGRTITYHYSHQGNPYSNLPTKKFFKNSTTIIDSNEIHQQTLHYSPTNLKTFRYDSLGRCTGYDEYRCSDYSWLPERMLKTMEPALRVRYYYPDKFTRYEVYFSDDYKTADHSQGYSTHIKLNKHGLIKKTQTIEYYKYRTDLIPTKLNLFLHRKWIFIDFGVAKYYYTYYED